MSDQRAEWRSERSQVKERSVAARTLRRREPKQESQTVIKVGSDFYIHASSLNSRRATRVLVNGESFAVFDLGGDILETPDEPLGFFHRDTRHLSRFELKIAGETPYYLLLYQPRERSASDQFEQSRSQHMLAFDVSRASTSLTGFSGGSTSRRVSSTQRSWKWRRLG